MKNTTITIDVIAKIKGGRKVMRFRFWIGKKLLYLAAIIMRTNIEVSVKQK